MSTIVPFPTRAAAPARAHGAARRFDGFTFELDGFRLLRGGVPVVVQPKVLDLLAVLTERPGVLCSRERLRAALWPDVHVTEQSLRQVVFKLRAAVGAHRIETVAGRGVRFVGEVHEDAPVDAGAAAASRELRAAIERLERLATASPRVTPPRPPAG